MSYFVKDERIDVTEGENTIIIRGKMGFGLYSTVQGAGYRLRYDVDTGETAASFDMGEYNQALMVHNVLGWRGPAFLDDQGNPVPCTKETILQLDPNEPLVQKALDEITARNPQSQSIAANTDAPNADTGG